MNNVKYPLALSATFIWIGFVCAISFMEAWLKFTAPGITIPLGLGIGRVVFHALNKVEWVLCAIIIGNYVYTLPKRFSYTMVFFSIAISILIIETFYALPTLDARATLYIKGVFVHPSNLHFYYIAMEFLKVTALLIAGYRLFK
ncbi:MAG: hypothetical protein ABL940_01255 [Bacteroidia bacterium]